MFFYSGWGCVGGGGRLVFQNKTYPEMLLYVDEGVLLLSGGVRVGLPWLQLLAPWEVKFSIYLHVSKASAKD